MPRGRRSNARPDATDPSSSGMPVALERPSYRVNKSVNEPGKWYVTDHIHLPQYFDTEFEARMYAAAHTEPQRDVT